MKPTLTISFDSFQEMESTLATLRQQPQQQPVVTQTQPVVNTPVQAPNGIPVTLEKIRELATKLVTDGKMHPVKAICDEYSLAKLTDAAPGHYDAIYGRLLQIAQSPV